MKKILITALIFFLIYRYFGLETLKWTLIVGGSIALIYIIWSFWEKGFFDEYIK